MSNPEDPPEIWTLVRPKLNPTPLGGYCMLSFVPKFVELEDLDGNGEMKMMMSQITLREDMDVSEARRYWPTCGEARQYTSSIQNVEVDFRTEQLPNGWLRRWVTEAALGRPLGNDLYETRQDYDIARRYWSLCIYPNVKSDEMMRVVVMPAPITREKSV